MSTIIFWYLNFYSFLLSNNLHLLCSFIFSVFCYFIQLPSITVLFNLQLAVWLRGRKSYSQVADARLGSFLFRAVRLRLPVSRRFLFLITVTTEKRSKSQTCSCHLKASSSDYTQIHTCICLLIR